MEHPLSENISLKDSVWQLMKVQGKDIIAKEWALEQFIHDVILQHDTFGDALAFRLAKKLGGILFKSDFYNKIFKECIQHSCKLAATTSENLDVEQLALEDLIAVEDRDPACTSVAQAFMYYKGYMSIQVYRMANVLWTQGRQDLAMLMQSRCSEVFGVDIHPAAKIKGGLMIDHATGVVVGETAEIGRNCSILHGVTLGGTGKVRGSNRHPKVGDNVLLGCNASIIGSVHVGDYARVGAGAVVIVDVPAGATVVGSSAVIKRLNNEITSLSSYPSNQYFSSPCGTPPPAPLSYEEEENVSSSSIPSPQSSSPSITHVFIDAAHRNEDIMNVAPLKSPTPIMRGLKFEPVDKETLEKARGRAAVLNNIALSSYIVKRTERPERSASAPPPATKS